jgi:hypothetical protein
MFPFWIEFSTTGVLQMSAFLVALVTWLTVTVSGRRYGI